MEKNKTHWNGRMRRYVPRAPTLTSPVIAQSYKYLNEKVCLDPSGVKKVDLSLNPFFSMLSAELRIDRNSRLYYPRDLLVRFSNVHDAQGDKWIAPNIIEYEIASPNVHLLNNNVTKFNKMNEKRVKGVKWNPRTDTVINRLYLRSILAQYQELQGSPGRAAKSKAKYSLLIKQDSVTVCGQQLLLPQSPEVLALPEYQQFIELLAGKTIAAQHQELIKTVLKFVTFNTDFGI